MLGEPMTVVSHRDKANPFRRSSILFRPRNPPTKESGGAAGYRPRVRSAYCGRVYVHSPLRNETSIYSRDSRFSSGKLGVSRTFRVSASVDRAAVQIGGHRGRPVDSDRRARRVGSRAQAAPIVDRPGENIRLRRISHFRSECDARPSAPFGLRSHPDKGRAAALRGHDARSSRLRTRSRARCRTGMPRTRRRRDMRTWCAMGICLSVR